MKSPIVEARQGKEREPRSVPEDPREVTGLFASVPTSSIPPDCRVLIVRLSPWRWDSCLQPCFFDNRDPNLFANCFIDNFFYREEKFRKTGLGNIGKWQLKTAFQPVPDFGPRFLLGLIRFLFHICVYGIWLIGWSKRDRFNKIQILWKST